MSSSHFVAGISVTCMMPQVRTLHLRHYCRCCSAYSRGSRVRLRRHLLMWEPSTWQKCEPVFLRCPTTTQILHIMEELISHHAPIARE